MLIIVYLPLKMYQIKNILTNTAEEEGPAVSLSENVDLLYYVVAPPGGASHFLIRLSTLQQVYLLPARGVFVYTVCIRNCA